MSKKIRLRKKSSEPNYYILCSCGCGESLLKYNKQGYERKYINGHFISKPRKILPNDLIICGCGCGELFYPYETRHYKKKCIKGHRKKIKSVAKENQTKICINCKQELLLTDFSNSKTCKYGVSSKCKKCTRIYADKWKIKNKDKVLSYKKKYKETHAEEILKRRLLYDETNKDRRRVYLEIYRKKNKNKLNAKILERKKNDKLYSLLSYFRSITYKAFNKRSWKKDHKTMEIIGCSIEVAKKWIELQFKKGMNWDNRGSVWHIDHKIPLSSAKNDKDLISLCHYRNLQPLYSKENIKKSNKIIEGMNQLSLTI